VIVKQNKKKALLITTDVDMYREVGVRGA
jgi:hypothetical protein